MATVKSATTARSRQTPPATPDGQPQRRAAAPPAHAHDSAKSTVETTDVDIALHGGITSMMDKTDRFSSALVSGAAPVSQSGQCIFSEATRPNTDPTTSQNVAVANMMRRRGRCAGTSSWPAGLTGLDVSSCRVEGSSTSSRFRASAPKIVFASSCVNLSWLDLIAQMSTASAKTDTTNEMRTNVLIVIVMACLPSCNALSSLPSVLPARTIRVPPWP